MIGNKDNFLGLSSPFLEFQFDNRESVASYFNRNAPTIVKDAEFCLSIHDCKTNSTLRHCRISIYKPCVYLHQQIKNLTLRSNVILNRYTLNHVPFIYSLIIHYLRYYLR